MAYVVCSQHRICGPNFKIYLSGIGEDGSSLAWNDCKTRDLAVVFETKWEARKMLNKAIVEDISKGKIGMWVNTIEQIKHFTL